MNIMFLMGSSHIEKNDEEYPFYLTEINEKLILEQQIEYCKELKPAKHIFCVKESDIKQFRVDSVIKQIVPYAEIVPIANQTRGAICTALLGYKHIATEEELILMAVDDFVSDSSKNIVQNFRAQSGDAGIVSFKSVHPRYSFAKTDESGLVVQAEEKLPISQNALVSFYYFRHGHDFTECAMDVIRKDNPIKGNFYISQTLNEMILRQKKVVMHKIPNEAFHPLKNEQHLAQYIMELNEQQRTK